MSVESVQDRRVERVENRRPSEVFLALFRERAIHAEIGVDEFAALADVWKQIRELEEIAARERRRESMAMQELLRYTQQADDLRPCGGETAPDPEPVCAPVRDDIPEGGPSRTPAPTDTEDREPVSESDTADDELDPRPIDELAAPDGKKYTGYGATFKNATRTRLLELRAQGLTTGKIMAAADGQLGYGELMDIIEGNKVKIDVYESLAGILDEIEEAAGKDSSPGYGLVRDDKGEVQG